MSPGVLFLAAALGWQTSAPYQAEQSGSADRGNEASTPAGRADVVYQVVFLSGGEILGAPTVTGQFGREVRVEIPRLMRVTLLTGDHDRNGQFHTSATLQLFRNNAWESVKQMSMTSDLTMTPSLEYSVEGEPYRFVIMPRLIAPAAD